MSDNRDDDNPTRLIIASIVYTLMFIWVESMVTRITKAIDRNTESKVRAVESLP